MGEVIDINNMELFSILDHYKDADSQMPFADYDVVEDTKAGRVIKLKCNGKTFRVINSLPKDRCVEVASTERAVQRPIEELIKL